MAWSPSAMPTLVPAPEPASKPERSKSISEAPGKHGIAKTAVIDSNLVIKKNDCPKASIPAMTILPRNVVNLNIPDIPVSTSGMFTQTSSTGGLKIGEEEWRRCMYETKKQAQYRQLRFASNKSIHIDETWFFEKILRVCVFILIFLGLPFSLVFCLKVVTHYERAVLFRLGRLVSNEASGPGLIFVLPCLDRYRVVDLRTFTFDVPTQEVLTKDSVTVAVNAVVYYRMRDPVKAIVNVEDANRSTRLLGQTTLRNVLGTVSLDQLLTARDNIAALMQECLDSVTEAWGVKVERVEIKDVRLPIQLQRAMAAEAEAAREATAKVIAAEGEQHASIALKVAAFQIMQHPIAMQLRYLQTISNICSGKESTIIFPVVMEMMELFQKQQAQKKEPSDINNKEDKTASTMSAATPLADSDHENLLLDVSPSVGIQNQSFEGYSNPKSQTIRT